MLEQFQNFDVNRITLDELVALAAFGRQLRGEYEQQKLDEPEWVGVQLGSIRREINVRSQDAREARIREIDARLAALKTPDEKKAELLKEKERLQAAL